MLRTRCSLRGRCGFIPVHHVGLFLFWQIKHSIGKSNRFSRIFISVWFKKIATISVHFSYRNIRRLGTSQWWYRRQPLEFVTSCALAMYIVLSHSFWLECIQEAAVRIYRWNQSTLKNGLLLRIHHIVWLSSSFTIALRPSFVFECFFWEANFALVYSMEKKYIDEVYFFIIRGYRPKFFLFSL